jgi:hypothetical protein
MLDHRQVIITSVPYCEPFPLVAPVLLAGCLEEAGITAKGVDFNIELLEHLADHPRRADFKNFLTIGYLVKPKFDRAFFKTVVKFTKRWLDRIVAQHQPRYLGLSIFTSESLDFGLLFSYLIRKHHPNLIILAGGKGLEVAGVDGRKHGQVWVDHHIVDAVIDGDAETAIIDAVRNNRRGMIRSQPQTKQDLDAIPLPKWNHYDLDIYSRLTDLIDRDGSHDNVREPYLAITGSKGCVRQCTFCDVVSFWPDYIYRDPVKVAQEIIHNYRSTGIKKFKFTDNLINGSISNFRRMNQIIVDEIPQTITYGGYAIFRGRSQMPEEDFDLAARAGNNFWAVGVESGSEKVRHDMKKKFDNDDLDWSVRMLYKYNIRQNWLLMVGYPSETEQDFQDTQQLLKRYQHLRHNQMITVQVTPTFMVLNNAPIVTNPTLASEYGLDHLHDRGPLANKFWTSTRFVDNDFPTRSRRWKQLVALIEDLGYNFGPGMPVQKWREEMENLDKIYQEQRHRTFAIHPV